MGEIELGSEVEDLVTGLKGMAISRATHLNGCDRYLVQARINQKDGKFPDAYWIDVQALKFLKSPDKLLLKQKANAAKPGGPASRLK